MLPQGSTLIYSTQYEFDASPTLAAGVIDANPTDANGDGLLVQGAQGGTGNAGSGIANGILHYVDTSNSGNFGYYWQERRRQHQLHRRHVGAR